MPKVLPPAPPLGARQWNWAQTADRAAEGLGGSRREGACQHEGCRTHGPELWKRKQKGWGSELSGVSSLVREGYAQTLACSDSKTEGRGLTWAKARQRCVSPSHVESEPQ